jgi:hypothetical protein
VVPLPPLPPLPLVAPVPLVAPEPVPPQPSGAASNPRNSSGRERERDMGILG